MIYLIVVTDPATGDTRAFHPNAITHVTGKGGTFTVWLAGGQQMTISNEGGVGVADFIDLWHASVNGRDHIARHMLSD